MLPSILNSTSIGALAILEFPTPQVGPKEDEKAIQKLGQIL